MPLIFIILNTSLENDKITINATIFKKSIIPPNNLETKYKKSNTNFTIIVCLKSNIISRERAECLRRGSTATGRSGAPRWGAGPRGTPGASDNLARNELTHVT